ncbi:adhesion G protein-coupled receptor E5-like isoform X2 [Brienomyrus brachyistius]|nr:adhesion G protein-coupled receptor E5-like isoform X2 [Brienomyrus brachyistius]
MRERSRNCIDVNECEDPVTHCGKNAICFNTVGSYYCQCKIGFIPSNTKNFTSTTGQCLDIDECKEEPDICGQNADCLNEIGSYYCECKPGFSSGIHAKELPKANESNCDDMNECTDPLRHCGKNATCFNTFGSYYCQCEPGFTSTPKTNFTIFTGQCNDVNECEDPVTHCGKNAICFNTVGSYYCQCKIGFIPSNTKNFTANTGQCLDIDECKEEPDICGQNADCLNEIGSYYCECKPGFSSGIHAKELPKANESNCDDMNECTDPLRHCGKNATCFNTFGSYYCQCEPGFTSTPKTNFTIFTGQCNDVNECEDPVTHCGKNAICFNTVGSYYCQCKIGFIPSNTKNFTATTGQCLDIDECKEEPDICGQNADCLNEIGSYYCECKPGFSSGIHAKELPKANESNCDDLNCDQFQLDNVTEQTLPELAEELTFFRSKCLALNKATRGGGSGDMLLERLLSIIDELLSSGPLGDNKKVSKLLALTENAIGMVTPLLKEPRTQMTSNELEVEILVNRSTMPPQGPVSLSSQYTRLDTHWETAAGAIEKYPGFAFTTLLSYNSLEKSTNGFFHEMGSKSQVRGYQIISKVVTASVSNRNTRELREPVTFDFSHTQFAEKAEPVCVFWNASLGGGGWSPAGCLMVKSDPNHTICSCNHLGSFAILIALCDKDPFELQLITWVGLSLSLFCLLLCIATFYFCKSIQGTRNTIHLHLCISLFVATLVFLVAISRTENKGACAFIAGLLHFFFLSAFCWMCLEGVQLYHMVVRVFNTTLRKRYLLAVGYGIPAVIVAISASANTKGYGTDCHCWLSLKDNFIWSFFGPVCAIIILNVFFFIVTVWKLAEKFSSLNPDLSSLRKIKTFTVTAIAQLCILGTMWIFGCFQSEKNTLAMSYLFTIFSSFQGVLVFVMHCLCSKQVREEYSRFLTSTCRLQKYTEFSSNTSSNSQTVRSSDYTESEV